MPPIKPIKRKDLIHDLKVLGSEGPYSGGKHSLMTKGNIVLRLPNPHRSDIGMELLTRILKQANIDRKTWENL